MSAGTLDKRLELQTRATGKDATGDQSQGWTTQLTVWARIRPLSARELTAAQTVKAETTHEICIRYRPQITHTWRGKLGARIFNFGPPVNEDEAGIWLLIPASEGLNNG